MKIYKTEVVNPTPYERSVCTHRECDLCGRKGIGDEWTAASYVVEESIVSVEMTCERGSSYPSGGSKEVFDVDLCPPCFEEKLITWINSQREGRPPIKPREVDW